MIQRKLGWRKQVPDPRDFKMKHLAAVKPLAVTLPPAVNLRRWCSYVEDQGELGSCTANAWAGILEFNQNKYAMTKPFVDLSRLFIYYNERVLDGTVNEDSGAQLRDGAKVIAQYGVCPEKEWPYDIAQFTVKPPAKAYADGLPYHIHSYYNLDGKTPAQTLQNLKTCIASGQPFVFGFTVYDSFMSDQMANTGIMPMPDTKTEQIQGGHAVMAIGYDDTVKRFLVRNSWGKKWGLPNPNYRGYFTMPYDFISDPNMASDFWTVVKDV
jgi:C1A family cysteine protease